MEPITLIQVQDIWPFWDAAYDNLNQVIKVQRTLNDHIDEGSTEIVQKLNETFQTMGWRTAMLQLILHPAQPTVEVHALDHGHSPRRPEYDHAYQRPNQNQGGNQRRPFRQEAPLGPTYATTAEERDTSVVNVRSHQ
ncbi:unnamed protein product [Heligmosomoides polygyrus]|uniref:DUF148 domain-containing protein n=1 Tax=Heligmosomoides polygyrus TaxID=6339 RepID=A0A183GKY6_HELPZ|nr:unnamed protein product [Heligmosomoides polygyrus]